MSKRDKHVKREFDPADGKTPKHIEDPDSFYALKPSWSFAKCDFDHDKWGLSGNEDALPDILRRLKAFEGMKWEDILTDKSGRRHGTKNHAIPISDLTPCAQSCISHLHLDDFDCLYSLTITGRKRLWGVMAEGVYCIIWFDPEHEICPSHKIYT